MPNPYLVTVHTLVPAPAAAIFDLLADPARHAELDGSGTVRASRPGNPRRLSLGAVFAVDMHLGAPYRIRNRVVEFEENRLIAWRHFNGHVWRYRLESEDGGTRVTEEWDARRARNRLLLRVLGFPARNRLGMERTLAKLTVLLG